MNALPGCLLASALLALALPGVAAPSPPPPRTVRIALDPGQYRALSRSVQPTRFAGLAHGYSDLVSASTGLHFEEFAAASSTAALQAVCAQEADLTLLLGELDDVPPCALAASPPYYRGQTLMVTRHAGAASLDLGNGATHRVAVVEGSRYPSWLQSHYPQVQVITAVDLSGALWAVETGVTDAALGLDVLVRPLVRREHADSLVLQAAPSGMPGNVHLVARAADRGMLEEIDAAMQAITPQQHAQVLQRLAQHYYFDAPSLAALFRHFRWEMMSLGMGLSVLLAIGFWLIRTRHTAQRSERRQARFIGVMSHEVRNAAQALVASVDLLDQSTLDQGQRQLVNAARAAGVGLRQLLGHALDYSRMAAGQFEPCLEWHDIDQLARDCVTAIRPAAEAKGLLLHLHVAPDPLPQLRTDAVAVRQILSNLLGNALKFTTQGSIEVCLEVLHDAGGDHLQLMVSDTGIGIPAARQASVFKPFAQAHDAHSRDMGGAGLGLSICQDLVDALRGQIHLHSEPGQGSRFTVRLPVSTPATPAHARHLPLSGHSLLLVEDHPVNRVFVARQLVSLGASVRACPDGHHALRLQAAHASSAVLIDCDLADMSGYQLAGALRDLERAHARLPALLVAFSASSSQAHVQRCRASGMDAVLCKPLDQAQLLSVLGASYEEAAAGPPRVDDNDPLWAPFLLALREEMQAVTLARSDGDPRRLRHHAHRAAGVLRMLGRESLAGTASDLHELALAEQPDWKEVDRLLEYLRQAVAALGEYCPT